MKKITFILLLFISIQLSAQNTDYFANDPQWRINYTFGGSGYCLSTYNYVYYVGGYDTINEHVYANLFQSGNEEYWWFGPPPVYNCSGTYEFNNPAGLFRQENKKIYRWNGNADEMLYDFDLDVGDTLPDSPLLYEDDIYVTAIDSILIGEDYRKVFSLSTSMYNQAFDMIEGVGFIHGFLSGYPDYFYPETLVCYALQSVVYYENPNSYGGECDMFVGIPDNDTQTPQTKIFPNPSDGNITVRIQLDEATEVLIKVFDITGSVLYKDSWRFYPGINEKNLNISDLPAGMYFITVIGENGKILSKKKVVVE